MQLFGSPVRRSFERQIVHLRKADRRRSVAADLDGNGSVGHFCEELIGILERVHATGDPRAKGELLANAYLRCEALRHLASQREDALLASAVARLLHDIPRYVERESPGIWKLVMMHAERLRPLIPSPRAAFDEELRRVRSEGFVRIETFLEKGREVCDYAERIYSHVLDAEDPADPHSGLHELAKAMLQADSLRRHASSAGSPRIEKLARELERCILTFVESDTARAWEEVRRAVTRLRAGSEDGGGSTVPGLGIPS